MKNQNRKSSSSSDQRTHRFWLSSSLSHGENEWTNWGGFSPLGGLETKARVCRRVRCRSQKGRAKRIETYLGGLARPLWSMGPLFTIHASTTLPRFLFRPHCPPEQHMAALYSSLSLSSRTNKSKHYRPCREYLLREDECTPGQNARNVFIRFESFQVPFADEGVLRDIVRNLDTDDVSIHMTTHYFLIIFPRVLFLFPLFHCILSQNVSINEIHLLSNNWWVIAL